ncbi:hypothetical protein [Heyndrickxia sporothermodurans]|uniref:hypothetical protein n=1 Tax=Heyndrickxia sporothermodurans TaxID=46224 RepID=UPI0035DC043D
MRKQDVISAWLGSIISILFFIIVNFLTSPNYLWFIYPSFFLLLWPLSMQSFKYGNYKIHSVIVSTLIIFFLLAINYLHSPEHPWILYVWYPIIWWPLLMLLEKKRTTVSLGIVASIVTIVYYSFLNIIISHGYPWAIYPIFAVFWWPMALYYTKKKDYFKFSISGSVLIILFFVIVNMVSSSHEIWAVYPIFVTLWWPLSMYYYYYRYRLK